MCLEVYLKPLVAPLSGVSPLTVDEVREIFGELEKIVSVSAEFCEILERIRMYL